MIATLRIIVPLLLVISAQAQPSNQNASGSIRGRVTADANRPSATCIG